jgi:pimeloyl-ACP methyl ester carboxylesterase
MLLSRHPVGREELRESDRIIEYEIAGDPLGVPVFMHHGTPGSSAGPRPRNAVLSRLGVMTISYSRPGYGHSTRAEFRSVASAATDVAMIADSLGIERFAVLGRSGGGPHALACAALLTDRVVRTAALVSLAPAEATDLDWYRNMAGSNVRAYRSAREDRPQLVESIRVRADRVRRDPSHLIDQLRGEMTDSDARVIDDPQIHLLMLSNYRDALAQGPYGWIDDVLAIRRGWGFDLRDISGPVRLWHGAHDRFAPASHTRWLADRIRGATVEVESGAAHFDALPIVPRMLEWLATPVTDFAQPDGAAPSRA